MSVHPSLVGAIDKIERRWLYGWAHDPGMPAHRLRVVVLLDGDVAGFALADMHRDDLLESGVGDGGHGFRCEMPPDRLNTARLITVLVEHRGMLALLHERSESAGPRQPGAETAPVRRRPAIHFDIADLLEFLSYNREVSGIQRVQCGYLSNALTMTEGAFEIRVCAQVRQAYRYVEIAPERAGELILAIDAKRAMPKRAWQDYVAREREGAGRAPDFRAGDVILTMGAPWINDDYYKAIQAAKDAHGVRYFQISYDMIPTVMPEVVSVGLIADFNRSIAGMVGCADHVLAISQYSQADLERTCARVDALCPPTSVIPLGGTIDYRQDAREPPAAPRRTGRTPRERYGEFVLCVGTIEARKNHLYLYHVWRRMLAEFGPAIPKLVCIGRMGWLVEELRRCLEVSAHLDGHFVHVADVGDGELKDFYQDCLFTVFPSIYEGWGLPVAESLLYRKLCVCSNATSMPEVGGDWVAYIDPLNPHDGFDVISGLIREPARIAAWEARLRADYRPVTWREATEGLLRVVEAAAARLTTDADDFAQSGGSRAKRIVQGRVYAFASPVAEGGALAGLRSELDSRAAAALLDGGLWYAPEAWGCWACGPVARLSLVLPAEASPKLVCYVATRLPPYSGTHACRIVVNGRSYGEAALRGGMDDELRLELTDVSLDAAPAGGRAVAIELHLDSLPEPDRGASDQRLLGVGLRALCVCAADDRDERLAYLERGFARIRPHGAIVPS